MSRRPVIPGRFSRPRDTSDFPPGSSSAIPALSLRALGARVGSVARELGIDSGVSASEADLLTTHARYGCLSLICTAEGGVHPFVFVRTHIPWKSIPVPAARLAYCRNIEEFVRFAGPLGRYLARRRIPLVLIDSEGPIPGLVGKFLDWGPKFFRGPHRPHPGDLAFTELVM